MEVYKKKKVPINSSSNSSSNSSRNLRAINIKVAKARSIPKPKTKPLFANEREAKFYILKQFE